MGKVKVGKSQPKNKHTGSPVESAFSKEEMLAIAENVMQRHKMTFELLAQAEASEEIPQISKIELHDKRARQYAKAVRKESLKAQSLCSILFEKMDEVEEGFEEIQKQFEDTNKRIESMTSFCKVQNKDIEELGKEQDKLSIQLELIEQELKIKPVHIKETKITERFDHRLLIINLVLVFLNIILLIK